MKRFAVLYTILFLCLILAAGIATADEAAEQAICVTDKRIAESIQFVRITSHDDFDTYKKKIIAWSKPGQPMGEAVSDYQIAIKDGFWLKNLRIAEIIYQFYPVGYAPEYVGTQILIACQWKFAKQPLIKNDVQEFSL